MKSYDWYPSKALLSANTKLGIGELLLLLLTLTMQDALADSCVKGDYSYAAATICFSKHKFIGKSMQLGIGEIQADKKAIVRKMVNLQNVFAVSLGQIAQACVVSHVYGGNTAILKDGFKKSGLFAHIIKPIINDIGHLANHDCFVYFWTSNSGKSLVALADFATQSHSDGREDGRLVITSIGAPDLARSVPIRYLEHQKSDQLDLQRWAQSWIRQYVDEMKDATELQLVSPRGIVFKNQNEPFKVRLPGTNNAHRTYSICSALEAEARIKDAGGIIDALKGRSAAQLATYIIPGDWVPMEFDFEPAAYLLCGD